MSSSAKSDAAYRLIKRDILNGRFAPVVPLRIAVLGELYGLSATPLREALSRLTEQGFATASANCGWRVADVSLAAVEDLEHARLTIELQLLGDAMAHGGLEWEAGIVGALHCLGQSVPAVGADDIEARQRWISAHEAFHAALFAAAPSATLRDMRLRIAEQLERHHQAILFTPQSFGGQPAPRTAAHLKQSLSAEHHRILAEPVLTRDLESAQSALKAHVETTLRAYRSLQRDASSDKINQQGEHRS